MKLKNRPLPTMWEQGKTIIMRKEDAEAWMKALRSGKFKQAAGELEALGGPGCKVVVGYCCLGVLQKVLCSDVERDTIGQSYALPSCAWLQKHGIRFRGDDLSRNGDKNNPAICRSGLHNTAASVNDSSGLKFPEIADLIEPCIQTY